MAAVEVHAEVTGPDEAPALVLAGSLGTTLAMWDRMTPLVADRLRVVRYDMRGHGRSPVPDGPYSMADLGEDVVALLDRLGVARAHFCGLSIGGMVGQWLGAHAADRIDRLVLMCTGSHLPDGGFTDRARTVREAGGPAPLAPTVVERWLTPAYAAERPEVRDWLLDMVVATPAEGYAGCCEAIGAMDLREDRTRIAAPTLVVSAAQDPSIPAEHGRALADAIPGARFELLDPGAHVVAVERPDACARVLLDHLESA